jgi:hypothetical protein
LNLSRYFAAKALTGGGVISNSAKQKLVINLLLAVQKGTSAYKDKYAKKDIRIAKSTDPKIYFFDINI